LWISPNVQFFSLSDGVVLAILDSGLTPSLGIIKMVHFFLPPLLGLLAFLGINVGGFLVMASGHVKERSTGR
jgi:hypothetical protein